jgi:hypothetical protein
MRWRIDWGVLGVAAGCALASLVTPKANANTPGWSAGPGPTGSTSPGHAGVCRDISTGFQTTSADLDKYDETQSLSSDTMSGNWYVNAGTGATIVGTPTQSGSGSSLANISFNLRFTGSSGTQYSGDAGSRDGGQLYLEGAYGVGTFTYELAGCT